MAAGRDTTKDDNERGIRTECAEEFAKVSGQLGRVANDKETDRAAMRELTETVKDAMRQSRADHDESVRQLGAYNTQVVALNGQMGERMASVEAKASSAHKRIDHHDTELKDQRRLMWGLLVLILTTTVGVLSTLIGG